MVIDFKLTLIFALTVFYIIFLELVNMQSYYFISILVNSLRFFQK